MKKILGLFVGMLLCVTISSVIVTAKDTAIVEKSAIINEIPNCFEALIPKGSGTGLKAEVTEICDETHTEVPWKFTITGGGPFHILIPISPLTGTSDFAAGETKIINVPLMIGVGNIAFTFTVGDEVPNSITANAFIIGLFVFVS